MTSAMCGHFSNMRSFRLKFNRQSVSHWIVLSSVWLSAHPWLGTVLAVQIMQTCKLNFLFSVSSAGLLPLWLPLSLLESWRNVKLGTARGIVGNCLEVELWFLSQFGKCDNAKQSKGDESVMSTGGSTYHGNTAPKSQLIGARGVMTCGWRHLKALGGEEDGERECWEIPDFSDLVTKHSKFTLSNILILNIGISRGRQREYNHR